MPIILPYDKTLEKTDSAFILPDGKIEYCGLYGHMKTATDYLQGPDFYELFGIKCAQNEEDFRTYVKENDLPWKTFEDIDLLITGKLNNEEKKLFLKWQDEYEFKRSDFHTDFMTEVLGIDKFSGIYKTITTTKTCPHIYYFNYLLMGYELDLTSPMRLNKDGEFEYFDQEISLMEQNEDKKYKEEIEGLIKNLTPESRHLYFK